MKPTPLLVALGLCIILAGFVYYTVENPPVGEDDSEPILRIEEEKILSISIVRPGHDVVTVQRHDDQEWVFGSPQTAIRVDKSTVDSMVSDLAELNADRVVEENINAWGPFGLQGAGAMQVVVTSDEGVKNTVVFGDSTPTGSGVFARLEGDPRLFTVFSYVKSGFEKEIFDLRDKKLLQIENDTAVSVQLTAGGKSIKFRKTSDRWQIVKPVLLRADNYVVSDLVRSVSDVEMMAVLEDTGKSTRRYYSRRPAALIEITDAAGSHTLTIFRGREGDEEYYAKSSDLTGIFEISSTVPSNLDKELADFRNDKLFDFGFKGIASLEVRNDETDLIIRKHENAWELVSQEGRILDSIKVQALIDALRNLTAKSYPSDQEISFAKYGLKEPMIEMNITTEEGSVDEVLVGIPKNNQIYAARRGEPSTYEVATSAVQEIQVAVEHVLEVDDDEEPLTEELSE